MIISLFPENISTHSKKLVCSMNTSFNDTNNFESCFIFTTSDKDDMYQESLIFQRGGDQRSLKNLTDKHEIVQKWMFFRKNVKRTFLEELF